MEVAVLVEAVQVDPDAVVLVDLVVLVEGGQPAVGLPAAVREVPVSLLQDTLVDQGAEIGRTAGAPDERAIAEVGQLPFNEPPTTGDKDPVSASETAWVR